MPSMRHVNTGWASTPSPCARVRWIALFTAAIHAALIAWAWRTPATHELRSPARVAMRLVMLPAAIQASALATPQSLAAPEPAAKPRRQARPIESPRPVEPPPRPSPARAEAIAGVAFEPPRIALPGSSSPARWMNPPAAPADTGRVMPPAMQLAQARQAQAMREAGRAQLADALQRELGSMQAPSSVDDGACALPAEPEPHLVCDNERLMQAIAPREAALSSLLQAWRSMEPGASGLSIAVVQGRYQVSRDVQRLVGASVTSTPRDVTFTAPGL